MQNDDVEFSLNRDEALVLFGLLARLAEDETLEVEDPAELKVLLDIHEGIGGALWETLSPKRREFLRQARQRVRATFEEPRQSA